MPIQVIIKHDGDKFGRELLISRTATTPQPLEGGGPLCEYLVETVKHSTAHPMKHAYFWHLYEEDVYVLTVNAIDALKKQNQDVKRW